MAARLKDIKINLLPKDKFAASSAGRVLAWLLSTFRIIVISVEMVVMLAFLSRFWLDSKNSDLNDEIKQKKAQITASKQLESEFRKIQSRLAVFSTLTTTQTGYATIIKSVTSQIPQEILLSSIDFAAGNIKLVGKAPNEQSIAQFIVNLQSVDTLKTASLTQLGVDKEDASYLTFTIAINATSPDTKKGDKS